VRGMRVSDQWSRWQRRSRVQSMWMNGSFELKYGWLALPVQSLGTRRKARLRADVAEAALELCAGPLAWSRDAQR
jgi:hypothetical protein